MALRDGCPDFERGPKANKKKQRALNRLAKEFGKLRKATKDSKEPLLKELPRGPRPAPRWDLEDARAEEQAWNHHSTRGQDRDPGRFN